MDVSELEFENIGLKSRISKLEANQSRLIYIISRIIVELGDNYYPLYAEVKELLTYIED